MIEPFTQSALMQEICNSSLSVTKAHQLKNYQGSFLMKGGWFLIKKSKINSPVERWVSVESEQEEEEGVALGEDVGNLLLLASVAHQLGSGDVGNLLRCLLFQIDAVDDLFEAIGEVELGEVGLRTDLL